MDQLDLFSDSRSVILSNEATELMLAGDLPAAAAAVARLRDSAPDAAIALAWQRLVEAVFSADDRATNPLVRLDHLDRIVAPAAQAAMGHRAEQLLTPRLRAIAKARAEAAYDANLPHQHPAALWLRLQNWSAAEAAALTIDAWPQWPDALIWVSQARCRQQGLAAARPTLFALAWRAPQRLRSLIQALGEPTLDRDWLQFERDADWAQDTSSDPCAWFPAWYLVVHPAAGADAFMAWADDGPAQAALLLRDLIALEKQADIQKLAPLRASLRAINAAFFGFYMQQRTTRHR